jgi:proteasome lid subunit RPN8/RPN11
VVLARLMGFYKMNILTENLKRDIKNQCLLNKTRESCGLIVKNNKEKNIFPCGNISKEFNKFIINPNDYLQASLKYEKIIGVYHSHINQNNDFSEFDKLNSKNHNLYFVLYNINTDSFKEYNPISEENPYVGINFCYGVNDCFSLVQKYYKNELNINLHHIERDNEWYKTNPKLFLDILKQYKNIFVKVEKPCENDIIVFKYPKFEYPHHLGIYLNGNLLLHHPRNRYSTIENYNNKYTYLILRPANYA